MSSKIGNVVSVIGHRTAAVQIVSLVKHPVYGKYQKRRKKYWADNSTDASIGDVVEIETGKFSKTKNFKIVRIVKKNSTGVDLWLCFLI